MTDRAPALEGTGAGGTLVIGIGGGGDVVGAVAIARTLERTGRRIELGGVAWERLPVDPVPGPRPAIQITGGEPLGRHAVLAGPDTATPEGVRFSESHVAAHLGAPTVLIDITEGPGGAAAEVAATTDYGGPVVAVVARGNVAGTQFHVEKSADVGLRILANFLRWEP